MQIAVFGGSGRLGRRIVKAADERGHSVKSLVRSPVKMARLAQSCSKLELIHGDPVNKKDLELTLEACDAVVTTLNISRATDFPWSPLKTPENLLSSTARALLELMPAHAIRRILVISAWGVHTTKPQVPGWFRWLIDHSNIGPAYQDHERQEDIISASELDWTILRPAFLSNSNKSQDFELLNEDQTPGQLFISRRSVAEGVVQLLETGAEIGEIKTVSQRK